MTGAQQVAAGMVWHPFFMLFLAPAQVEQAATLVWAAPCSLAPSSCTPQHLPSSLGPQRSVSVASVVALHLAQAGVAGPCSGLSPHIQ